MAIEVKEQLEALNPEPQSSKKDLDLDTILQQEVGQFGWFQVRNILLSLIVVIFLAWSNSLYIFTTARIPTRCYIPECDVDEPEFTPKWLLNAIPGTSLTSFDHCQRYGNATAVSSNVTECSAAWFDQNQLKSCERHVYGNKNSVVYDFDLGCDEWRRTLIGSIRISGTFFTHLFTGYISDRWGRRTALVLSAFNCGWLGVLKYFANSYIGFVALEFIQAVFGGGSFQSAYILLLETVGSKNRVITGAIMNTCLSVGFVTLGLAAWAIPNWRLLILVLSIPQLFTISYRWLMSESVRWYMSKGRFNDVENTLKNIAKTNKKHLSDKSVELIRKLAEDKKHHQEDLRITGQKDNEPSLLKLLFKHKPILFRCLVTPFLWITFTFIYQGLSINAVGISGNKYVNYMSATAAQIPGFWFANYFLDKFGRKPTIVGAFWICAACQIGYVFIPDSHYAISLCFYLVSTCCSGAMLSGLYIYTAELYPTPYRHRFFAYSSMMGRFGSVFAPLTPALNSLSNYVALMSIGPPIVGCPLSSKGGLYCLYLGILNEGAAVWEKFPFALFAGCACAAGALVLLTPETRGLRLPDTMQEAADLGRKKQAV